MLSNVLNAFLNSFIEGPLVNYLKYIIIFALLAGMSGATSSDAAEGKGAVDERIQSTFDAVERGLYRGTTPDKQVEKLSPNSVPMSSTDSEQKKDSLPLRKETATQPGSSVPSAKYYALIIGIDRYRQLPKLENAANDAIMVGQVLREKYGFETRMLLNEEASRDAIMSALNDLRRQLTEDVSLLIYYSGHGEYNAQTETSYWLPVDASRNDTTKWLESRSISDQLKLITARHILVVADSCFSGTITRSASGKLSGKVAREKYLQKVLGQSSRVLIASGGNEPVLDAGGRVGHSVFADSLIDALSEPFDKVFTAEELMSCHLKESVAGRAEQLPEYKVIRNSGHEGGDFVFRKIR